MSRGSTGRDAWQGRVGGWLKASTRAALALLLTLVTTGVLLGACGGESEPDAAEQTAATAAQQEQAQDTGADEPPPSGPVRVSLPAAVNRPAGPGEAVPAAEATGLEPQLDVEGVARAVVRVEAALLTAAGPETIAFGSGSIVDAEGLVLTNFHVIDPALGYDQLLIAMTGALDAAPEARFVAEVQVSDPLLDLAVLRIVSDLAGNPVKPETLSLPTLTLGDSDEVAVLDRVLAFGFPDLGDETLTVTAGSISGFLSQAGVANPRAWFKTDTTISFGNSGGAAVNARGELVGVPTQGRSNEIGSIAHLRPIGFAAALLEAARAGASVAAGVPSSGVGRSGAPVFDIAFGRGVDESGTLVEPGGRFAAGTDEIFYSFRFEGLEDGAAWNDRWLRDGEAIAALSEPRPPWEGGDAGSFVSGIADGEGFADGVYTLEVVVEGEVVASRSLTVGEADEPELRVGNYELAGGVSATGEPLEPQPNFPVGTSAVYVFFEYENAGATGSFEAIWSRGDEDLARVGPLPWDGAAEGRQWVSLANPRGFAPGVYSVALLFDGVQAGAAFVSVALDRAVGDPSATLAPGEEASGELNQGDVSFFRLTGLVAGRPLRVSMTGLGDADLYVKRGEQTLPDEFGQPWDRADLRAPFVLGSDETVLVEEVGAGETWFVAVVGFEPESTFALTVEQPASAAEALPALTPGEAVSGDLDALNPDDEFVLEVPAGTRLLSLVMTGVSDVDLYARPGQQVSDALTGAPSAGPEVWAPFNLGASEVVTVEDPAAGLWFVRVVGFELPALYTLEVAFDTLVEAPQPRPTAPIERVSGVLDQGESYTMRFEYGGGGGVLLGFTMGGQGDADLYVRFEQEIGAGDLGRPHDGPDFQAPFVLGSSERAVFAQPLPGTYFVTIVGEDEFNSYDLAIYELTDLPETLGLTPLLPNEPESFALREGEDPLREIFVPPGTERLEVALSGGGDVDLVLRYLEAPDPAQYLTDARGPELFTAIELGSEESIVIERPLPGVYLLAVVAMLELQVVDVTVLLD